MELYINGMYIKNKILYKFLRIRECLMIKSELELEIGSGKLLPFRSCPLWNNRARTKSYNVRF